jgi:hypothetical protein
MFSFCGIANKTTTVLGSHMILESKFFHRLQGPSSSLLLAALAVSFSIGTSAHAANIVADSGFEAAGGNNVYYSGQSIDSGSWTVTQGSVYIDTQDPYVYQGNNSLNLTLANPYVPNSIAQTLTTVAGQQYLINFYGDADSPNAFSLTENGISVTGIPSSIADLGFPSLNTNGNSSLFTDYSASFVATSNSTILDFTATGDPAIGSPYGSVMIDNVNVQATPEPGSLVLMLTGVAGLGLLLGKKRLESSSFTI